VKRLEKTFLQQLRNRRLVAEGEHLLVAVSGGPDSMALLYLLCAVASVVRCRISVAHCNFQLRGEESDSDERFVMEQCRLLGVECFCRQFNTAAVSASWKKSVEETARLQRYSWFETLLQEREMTKIATGHHVSDNAETILFNLFRGTSLLGLKGIRAMHGRIIRPLLLLHKSDILGYLEEKKIPFRTDATNEGIDYDRNFIRNRVIPLIEERFEHKLTVSLQRLSEQAGELEAFLEGYFERLAEERPALFPEEGCLDVAELRKLSLFEQKEIFKRALQESGASPDAAMLQRLVSLLDAQPGKKVVVNGKLFVEWKGCHLLFQVSP